MDNITNNKEDLIHAIEELQLLLQVYESQNKLLQFQKEQLTQQNDKLSKQLEILKDSRTLK